MSPNCYIIRFKVSIWKTADYIVYVGVGYSEDADGNTYEKYELLSASKGGL